MSGVQPPTAAPVVPDRSTGLMVFGIFQIVLGGFCGMASVMMVFITILGPIANTKQAEAINPQTMIPGIAINFLLSVTMIWLGIGSIRARRWAWTLTVVLSWMWLIMGVIAFIGFLCFAGSMISTSLEQQGQVKMPQEVIMVMRIVTGAMMFGIYILLPTAFLLFYQRASVLATCRWRDPQIRWTDHCPMPVLALSVLMAFSAVSMLFSIPANRCVMPLFGGFVSGTVGAIVIVLIVLALMYLAWGTYRLQMAAWWGTLLLWTVGIVNMVMMFLQTNLMEMYEKMRMPATQLEMIRKSSFIELVSRWGLWIALAFGIVWLGYLLYIRRYFTCNIEEAPGVSQTN